MKNCFVRGLAGAIGIGMIGMVGLTHADFAKPEDAIRYRQSAMVLIGYHFGNIAAVVKGEKKVDPQEVTRHAETVASVAKLPWEAFAVPGSAKNSSMKEEALQQKEAFTSAAREMEKATEQLARAAAGGNMNEIRSGFGAAGQSCKACHDRFRAR